MWTPRKTLVVAAHHQMKRHNLTPHLAIEEVVSNWKQQHMNAGAVSYYMSASDRAVTRLINEVQKGR